MKNVAIINISDYGSTGKIAEGLHKHLRTNGYNSLLCCGRGKTISSDKIIISPLIEIYCNIIVDRFCGDQGCHEFFATKRLLKKWDEHHIDSLFIINLHANYINEEMIFRYAVEKNIPIVYIMADEYPFLGKCGYNKGCNNYKTGCGNCPQKRDYPQSWFFDRSKKKFKIKEYFYPKLRASFVAPEFVIDKAKTSPLMKGLSLIKSDESINVDKYKPFIGAKEALGIPSDIITIVTVVPFGGKLDRKGGFYFQQLAKSFEKDDKFLFIHVGYQADATNRPTNMRCIGYVSDQNELIHYYSAADLFVFPSLEDTMPNTCLEALSCGSPLLCFNISGMPYIADNICGKFVEPENVEELRKVVLSTKVKSKDMIEYCRQYAVERYDSKKYYNRLITVMLELEK